MKGSFSSPQCDDPLPCRAAASRVRARGVLFLLFSALLLLPVPRPCPAAPQDLPALLEQARSEDPQQRAGALESLSSFSDPEADQALIRGLKDPVPEVRGAAAMSAIGHRGEPVILALVETFGDAEAEVRRTALSVFIMNNNPLAAGYRPLLALLDSPDSRTRAYAAWALGLYRDEGAVAPLARLAAAGEPLERANACWALGEIGSEKGLEPLHRGLTDGESSVREKAAAAAGRIGSPRSAEPVLRLLTADGDRGVRLAAARALGRLGSPQALPALAKGLREGDPALRSACCASLEALLDGSIRGELEAALADGDGQVRACAARLLGVLGDARSRPALEKAAAGEEQPTSKKEMEDALGRLRPGEGK